MPSGVEGLEQRQVLSASGVSQVVATVPMAPLAAAVSPQNDTLNTAEVMGFLQNDGGSSGTTWTQSGTVNKTSDPWDYYKFVMTSPTHVKITLTGMSSDVDIVLRTASKVLATSSKGGTASELIDGRLSGGTYYIQVKKYGSGSSSYTLKVFSGDYSMGTAWNLGGKTSASGVTVSGRIGTTDAVDYFKFTVSGNRGVDVYLSEMTHDGDLEVLNSSGTVIGRSVNAGTTPDRVRLNLKTGTYYIRVKPYSGVANLLSSYTLKYTNAVSGGYATQIGKV